jgi:hypothetical protein
MASMILFITGIIIEELKREAKDNNNELSIVLLDAKYVFDVVDTDHLLRSWRKNW